MKVAILFSKTSYCMENTQNFPGIKYSKFVIINYRNMINLQHRYFAQFTGMTDLHTPLHYYKNLSPKSVYHFKKKR